MVNQRNITSKQETTMQVTAQQYGEVLHIKPQGTMVYEHSAFYAEQMQGLLLQTGGLYLVDVDLLERIDSTGFGVLITFARLVVKQGGKIGFVVTNPFLRELFLMAQFDKVFPVAETVEQGKALLVNGFSAQIELDHY